MNKYELVYIITPEAEEEARKALNTRIQDLIVKLGGEVTKVEDWGKRRLAYAINYKTEGWYVLVNFNGEGKEPREIERNLGNIDSVIRYQIIHVLDKRSNVKPRPVRAAAPAEAPQEAPAEAPAAE
ncbi:MAG: 30S ribosomal protein S6 [Clostridia bacterium]|nr:30S ribosomal protein S6 [Clostridia bacterium]